MGRSAAAGCPHILSARRPHVLPGPGRRAGIPHQLRAAVAKRDASARARTDGMGLRDWQAAAVLPVMSRGVTLAQGIAGRLPPMTRTPRVTNHTVALPRTGADRAPRCRASDVLKPACPWCGASTSAVYLSRADLAKNVYRRRRRCDEYRRQWPTVEDLDRDRFARELRALGLTLDDLGSSSTAGAHGGRAPHG